MVSSRLRTALCLAVAAAVAVLAAGVSRAEPVKIRIGWLLVPAEITPILFPQDGIAKHLGKSYVIESTRFQGSSMLTPAIASGEIDVAPFGYSSFSIAVENANLKNLRIFLDEDRDGMDGHFSTHFMVRNDSPIKTIADLKGKVVASNALGSIGDMALRLALKREQVNPQTGITTVEVGLPNMNAILSDGKADMIMSVLPFYLDPALQSGARTVFTSYDSMGPAEISLLTATDSFLAKNRAAMVDFVEDYLASLRWYNDPANHDAAMQAIADFTKLPADRFTKWAFTQTDYYRDPKGIVDVTALQKNLDDQFDLGFLKSKLDIKPYVDMSIAEEADKRSP